MRSAESDPEAGEMVVLQPVVAVVFPVLSQPGSKVAALDLTIILAPLKYAMYPSCLFCLSSSSFSLLMSNVARERSSLIYIYCFLSILGLP